MLVSFIFLKHNGKNYRSCIWVKVTLSKGYNQIGFGGMDSLVKNNWNKMNYLSLGTCSLIKHLTK